MTNANTHFDIWATKEKFILKLAEFKSAVMNELLPTWLFYPGAPAVRVSFSTDRDDHAPNVPLVLAVNFASCVGLEAAMNSQERLDSLCYPTRFAKVILGPDFHFVTESSESLAD